MKLGFWMLGMPDWTNEEIAQRAAAHGYSGVDLRCQQRDVGRPSVRPMNISIDSDDGEIERTKAAFATADVEISSLLCYNPSPCTGDKRAWEIFEQELALHAGLARKLGSSSIRFQLEGPPEYVSWEDYLVDVWGVAGRVLDAFPGMTAVIENHIQRASAAQLLATAERMGDPRLGLEFSPEHALVMQEKILDLIDRYAPHIHKICWADRKVVQHDLGRFDGRYYYVRYQSCWIGDGMMPTKEIISRLVKNGFDGYISLKWEKSSWFGAHLPDGETALAYFPGYMRKFATFER
jgi:sugar phosphate isomerase/epimerase